MSYYKEVKRACQEVDKKIRLVLDANEVNIAKMIIEITANHEVGEKVILKRIEHYKKAFPGIKELQGVLYYDPEQ
jgi:hypothetical protein